MHGSVITDTTQLRELPEAVRKMKLETELLWHGGCRHNMYNDYSYHLQWPRQ